MFLMRQYRLEFHGEGISHEPVIYPLWRILLAKVRGQELPKTRRIDHVTVTITIQGPANDPTFIDREFDVRKAYYVQGYAATHGQLVDARMVSEVRHRGTRPTRDFSPGQSKVYQDWLNLYYPPKDAHHGTAH